MKNTSMLEEVFFSHYQEWCLMSFSYVQNLDDAKDVVQNVFLLLLQKEDLSDIKNLKNYITVSIRNESLKKVKKSKNVTVLSEYNLAVEPFENKIIDIEISQKIHQQIEALPEQNKKIFKLCVLEGVKYKNAADMMGISVNTIKYHLKNTFKTFRINLRDVYLWFL